MARIVPERMQRCSAGSRRPGAVEIAVSDCFIYILLQNVLANILPKEGEFRKELLPNQSTFRTLLQVANKVYILPKI